MTEIPVLFSTGSLYLFDLSHTFALAAEAGYDGIEVMCDERFSSRDPVYLSKLSKDSGLPIRVLHTPFSPRTPGWRDPQDEIKRIGYTLELAEKLGAQSIVVHLPRRRELATATFRGRTFRFPWREWDNPLRGWIEHDLPKVQAKTKVKIGIENMPAQRILGASVDFTWWNEVETWSKVHQWLTLDTTHWGTKHVDPLDAYRAAGKRVCHVHLSNYDGYEHQLPRHGKLNLKAFLRALAADGYAGTISLELNPHVLSFKEPYMVRKNMAESVTFCRENLKQPSPPAPLSVGEGSQEAR